MFDHLGVVVRDLERGRAFYDACLGALGYALLEDHSTPARDGWLVYGPANHAAFLFDPDGNNVEAGYRNQA
jgi:catechol 2,3-dioxygenase-like lactoylglutathione lyase family enzyme